MLLNSSGSSVLILQHGAFLVSGGWQNGETIMQDQKKEKDNRKNQKVEQPKKERPILPKDVQRLFPEMKIRKLPKDWCRTFFKR